MWRAVSGWSQADGGDCKRASLWPLGGGGGVERPCNDLPLGGTVDAGRVDGGRREVAGDVPAIATWISWLDN